MDKPDGYIPKHPLARCWECPLREVGKFVPSEGPQKATIAFVGEAPGAQEARGGRPFVGPSGKLLDTVNAHHGIKREEVFLTNACLCRPPDNSTPPKSAIEACRPRLLDELQKRGARTVVALGNSATESLIGKTGVTSLRVGPGKRSANLPNVRIIPTLHPAAALRQADLFPHIVTDIGKVNLEPRIWNPPNYVIADDEVSTIGYLRQLLDRKPERVVLDIEVDIEKDTAFGHPNQYGMLCVGIGYAKSRVLVLGESAMASREVRILLGRVLQGTRIVCQNGKFDLAGLYPILGGLELYFDTMLASYVFDERPGIHGLKYQAVEYLGAPQYDVEIKKYIGSDSGYGAIPRDKLYEYNATDCAVTWDRMEQFEEQFEKHPELRKVHDFLVAASNQLMYVELNGISIDLSVLDELTDYFIESIGKITQEIQTTLPATVDYTPVSYRGPLRFNPASPQQVKKALADFKIIVDKTNIDTLEVVLAELEKRELEDIPAYKFVKTLMKHRKEAKLYGTYVKGIRKRLYGGRVFPTFLLHGTTTGRLACRNPNLQNIPRESNIRRLYVPSKAENVFVQTDYSQAELRVLSYLAGDNYFRTIFNESVRDVFDDLTPQVFPGRSKDQMGAAEWKELRVRVKAFVYGLAYGRTAEGLAKEYEMTLQEARIARDNFFQVIPEIVEFLAKVRSNVLAGNDLITPWGRHRRFMLITKENKDDVMNQAQAFLPQSTASDMCLMAMTNVRQDLKGIGYVRNIVHDSILAECHADNAERVKEIMERRMVEAGIHVVGDYVKIDVETKIGKSWGEV